MGGKRRSATDLIIDMKHLGEKLGHAPSKTEVNQAASTGEVATAATYISHFGINPKTGQQSWALVLESCGMKMPKDRYGRGHKLDPRERARRNHEKAEKQKIREEKARKKRIAKFQAAKAKMAEAPSEPAPAIPAQKHDKIFGRQAMADTLELINLTGMPVLLSRHKKTEILPCITEVKIFAETYKFLDDYIVDKEINQLFGGVQTRKVVMPFCLVDKSGERHRLPEPKPGVYYLVSRKVAELIASTGRSMEDLIFPLQYHKVANGVLAIETIGIKPPKSKY